LNFFADPSADLADPTSKKAIAGRRLLAPGELVLAAARLPGILAPLEPAEARGSI
jgi:hypothetical protein